MPPSYRVPSGPIIMICGKRQETMKVSSTVGDRNEVDKQQEQESKREREREKRKERRRE